MLKIKYANILFYIVLVAYKAILDIIYTNFVSVVFQYAGFQYASNTGLSVIAWSIYLSLIFFIKPQYYKPSDFFLFIFFVLVITPMIVLMELGGKSLLFLIYTIMSFLLIKLILTTPNLKIPKVKYGNKLVLAIAFFLILITFLMFLITGGISRINFDLSLVYELRAETASVYFGGIWGYITPWSTKIFLPFLLSLSLFYKKHILVLILIGTQILVFGVTGHRSMGLLWIVSIGIYLTRNANNKNLYIITLITIMLLSLYLIHIIFDDLIIISTIARRAFFVPSFLNYSYYDFFLNHEHVFYSNSVLSKLIEYPYGDVSLSKLVSGQVFGEPEGGANTGFIGTSFAHTGVIGMIVISCFVGIIFKVLDGTCNSEKHTWFYLSFVSIPILALLTSASFFTSLLTHGVLIIIMITWLHEFEEPDKIQ